MSINILGMFIQDKGNTKVKTPIVNLGSATSCPSMKTCPHSAINWKNNKVAKCYALKTEQRFPIVRIQRENNRSKLNNMNSKQQKSLAKEISIELIKACKKMKTKFVRLNESGDLSSKTLPFVIQLSLELKKENIRLYTYSQANNSVINTARKSGIQVLKSGIDFIIVKDKKEAKELGFKLCPATSCGKGCTRCPKGLQSAVIEH